MPGYDGFGTFTRGYNWVADKLALIDITASRMDAEFDTYATAMNQVILRNGVAAMSGDLKLGGNKITGIGAGLVGTPSLAYSGDVTTGIFFPAAGTMAFVGGGVERMRVNSTGVRVPAGQHLDVLGILATRGAFEDANIIAAALTGAVEIDFVTAAVVVYTLNAVANWTFDLRGDVTNTLNSLMAIGQALTVAVEVPQGNPAFYCTAITVDGAAPAAIKWFGGVPGQGNVSGIDVYSITVIKTANATFQVRASQVQAF